MSTNKKTKALNTVSAAEKELRRLEWQKKLSVQKEEQESKTGQTVLSKAELKAKRRQQQEAQRIQKTQIQSKKNVTSIPQQDNTLQKSKIEIEKVQPTSTRNVITTVETNKDKHLQSLTESSFLINNSTIHSAFISLGVQHKNKIIVGSNARALSLLVALKRVINDICCPLQEDFTRHCETIVNNCICYLQTCRSFSVSMNSALRFFKMQLSQDSSKINTDGKKKYLINAIENYINDEICKGDEAISLKVNEKISECGDVILTFGCSSLVKRILIDAHKTGKDFRVIIVDGRPFFSGRKLLRHLLQADINCTYTHMNALSHVIRDATKVLLGAHSLLANGYVMARMGTAQIALVARSFNKPVLVCCETYKFTDRVQTDAFVYNETDGVTTLLHFNGSNRKSPLTDLKQSDHLSISNFLYDVTPADLVSAVVTELAILPCTSVPVVLRVKPVEFT